MLQNNPVLKSKIVQLWNKFWAGGIANPLTAIEQITYLLFMKRLDDLDLKQQADADFTGDTLISRFTGVWVPPARERSQSIGPICRPPMATRFKKK
jgi:type I restriction enzyme M protein